MIIKGEKIFLRHLKKIDIDTLHEWENNPEVREVSDGQNTYSKRDIEHFVNSHHDIYLQKQLRLMICENKNEQPVGCIDLFQFDAHHSRAGVGILIFDKNLRNRGYGGDALQLLIQYCIKHFDLKQLYCNVQAHNKASINLFQKAKFKIIGLKKEWNRNEDEWEDEIMMQLLLR